MAYPEKSYYDTLGVPRNATQEQIKAAYREQIKYFHPDVFQGSPEVAKEKSLELNEAFSVLSDPQKRDKYDFWLKVRDYQRAKEQRDEQESAEEEERQETSAPEPERKSRPAWPERAKTVILFLSMTLCISLALTGASVYRAIEAEARFTEVNAKLDSALSRQKTLERSLENKDQRIIDLRREYNSMYEKSTFIDNNVVFVTSGGKRYHRYDCHYFQDAGSFYAFNVAYARYLGYTPCLECRPPTK